MDLDAFSKGKAKGAKNAWEKGKGKENKGKGKKGACYNCGSPDHMQNQCPKGKGGKEERRKERRKVAREKRSATSAGDTATTRPIARAGRLTALKQKERQHKEAKTSGGG
eukprot:543129-Amphidinium_carterae.1